MRIESEEWKNLIIEGAEALGLPVDRVFADQLAIHAAELISWAKKINLTTITNPFEIGIKHYLDSLIPAPLIPAGASLLDIGTGGGFPGIPLKILLPSLSVTLIDASRKKVSFLKHVIRTLKLTGIEARQIRAEDLARQVRFRHAFEVIVSRALAALDAFIVMALPLLAPKGILIALKGQTRPEDVETALENALSNLAIPELRRDGFALKVEDYVLPMSEATRSIIIIRHVR
ncbi:MAG: 16S rRNA (guanine(527)-N(7))-methyltransferase RsmG [Desulfobacterales bacterium]|nr:MAG: 16S rRNA (guanine(527)-N(7))-methyltransferase RsmG [Desulfobacterales bacterium]